MNYFVRYRIEGHEKELSAGPYKTEEMATHHYLDIKGYDKVFGCRIESAPEEPSLEDVVRRIRNLHGVLLCHEEFDGPDFGSFECHYHLTLSLLSQAEMNLRLAILSRKRKDKE